MKPSPDAARTEAAYLGTHYWRLLYPAMTYLPWIWLAIMAVFATGVILQTGQFPYYGNPDPKDTGGLSLLYFPSVLFLTINMAIAPAWLIITAAAKWRGCPVEIQRRDLVIGVTGMALFVLVLYTDSFGLITWLAD